MVNIFDVWDHKRDHDDEPEPQPPPPVNTTAGGTAYGLRALDLEAQELTATPEGFRNDKLNAAVYKLAGLVAAGHLTAELVRDRMTLAARACGLDERETAATIASGGRAGLEHPRQVPALPPLPQPATLEVSTSGPHGNGVGGHNDPDAETNAARDAQRAARLALEVENLRAKREARRIVVAEEHAAMWQPPAYTPTLTDELALPDEPVTYRVDEVMPIGANIVLTAQYKVGKTTLTANLTRALADGKAFLDRFATHLGDGRVALWNYEVTRDQFRHWLRDLDVTHTEAVTVLNLRGTRMPLAARLIEDWAVAWLIDHHITVWLVDPYARAIVGSVDNENDNSQTSAFLDLLDVIKARAGVSELVLPAHTGRADLEPGTEHARGAARLDDWADVRWILTADQAGQRYFRANGRDVDVPEGHVTFDHFNRRLALDYATRTDVEAERLEGAILDVVTATPGIGMVELIAAVHAKKERVRAVAWGMTSPHRFPPLLNIERTSPGPNGHLKITPAVTRPTTLEGL
jgi:hypothetical protein